jgi:hypothetical protein
VNTQQLQGRDLLSVFPFDIDVVYTWVDGADPKWQAARRMWSGKEDKSSHAADAHDHSRWRDYGTLKWSLRSVAKHMPWVRRIYLVTDEQRPDWLKEDDRLRVVSHASFFGSHVKRPTFNSHVIESQLHKIEGLSEHFIYLNDDVLITRPTSPGDFFWPNGIVKVFPGVAEFQDSDHDVIAVNAAGQNLRDLFSGQAWAPIVFKMRHTAFALRRSVLEQIEQTFFEQFKLLGQQQFRSKHDIAPVSQVFPYFAFLTGRAVSVKVPTAYVDVGRTVPLKGWIKLLTSWDYITVCLNCSLSDEASIRRNAAVLDVIFKMKFADSSPWER